jgi:phosphoenolpyruvate-protein phosphotransferase (PTS system enzyme I)
MTRLEGISISPGYANGIAVVYDFEVGRRLDLPRHDVARSEVQSEWERLDDALEKSSQDLRLVADAASQGTNRRETLSLLSAHSAMTSEIATLVKQHISNKLVNAEQALESVIQDWVARLQRLDSEYLRQREQDVRDVGRRMTRYLAGSLPWCKGPLPASTIVVARELLPSEAIELANCGVVALVTERGGKYSHTAILSRSLGIPAVTRVLHATSQIHPGATLLVDGRTGSVTIEPTVSDKESFERQKREYAKLISSNSATEKERCVTQDGVEISLLANIGRPEEIGAVAEHHFEGVGLFRTEFLFLESQEAPSDSEQLAVYEKLANSLNGLPLTIRTFDLGGDKLLSFVLSDASEPMSKLHPRGLRFSLAEKNLFLAQVRAILHAAQSANIRLLFPMVIGSEDLTQAIAMVDHVVNQYGYSHTPSIGAMIETPAALYCLDSILDLVDFVALGTNDLAQFMLASDRDSSEGTDDLTAVHPAVLRAINQVIEAAGKRHCPVYACGEEVGDCDFACLLIGLGIRELSLSPWCGAAVRQGIRGIDTHHAHEVAGRALACRSVAEVRNLLSQLHSSEADSAISPGVVPSVIR